MQKLKDSDAEWVIPLIAEDFKFNERMTNRYVYFFYLKSEVTIATSAFINLIYV